jgi:hypothetical protein
MLVTDGQSENLAGGDRTYPGSIRQPVPVQVKTQRAISVGHCMAHGEARVSGHDGAVQWIADRFARAKQKSHAKRGGSWFCSTGATRGRPQQIRRQMVNDAEAFVAVTDGRVDHAFDGCRVIPVDDIEKVTGG